MEFTISRTTSISDKPCDNAYKKNTGKSMWAIEIETLEDLEALSKAHGALIIDMDPHKEEDPSIEIYDDYRE